MITVAMSTRSLTTTTTTELPLKVIIAGLNHDHVITLFYRYEEGKLPMQIVGIAEPDKALRDKIADRFQLTDMLFGEDMEDMLKKIKPEAVWAFNPTSEHLETVRICAQAGIPVMVEKPLAATLEQARQIAELAEKYQIPVLTNYETSWYPSNTELYRRVIVGEIGDIRKMMVHDGNEGPKERGKSQEFLSWLTDPEGNGAGALNDFGCYGPNLMTWLMKGERPLSVTAITKTLKPDNYPNVDDDATILLEYPKAVGIMHASWNWPFPIKDLEVYGERGYLHAPDQEQIVIRTSVAEAVSANAAAIPSPYEGPVQYLAAIVRKVIDGKGDLSSLENNMIVMEVLDAAKRSAATGMKVHLA